MNPAEIIKYLQITVDREFDTLWLNWDQYQEISSFLDRLKEEYNEGA